MAAENSDRRDPIDLAAERARRRTDRTLLPSSGGLGPGAGETPDADVTVESDDAPPATPTLRGVERRRERPVTRSSQLDGAPPESDES